MQKKCVLIFALITVIGAMAVFILVASLFEVPVIEAQRLTMNFLAKWGGIAPEKLNAVITLTIGGSVSFAMLFALSLTFNALADASIQRITNVFGHFGIKEIIWSEMPSRLLKNNSSKPLISLELAH